jgi:hypothetical protein
VAAYAMTKPDQSGSEAFRWLDAHMIESLDAPDEAFDQVYMLRPEDWPLFERVWAERPPRWREALVYVLVDGPVSESQPLLRRALADLDHDVAAQAAISFCHQMIEYPDRCPFEEALLPRLKEIRKAVSGDMTEVDIILQRYERRADNARPKEGSLRRTIFPSQIEILRDHLKQRPEITTVYFEAIADADYLAWIVPQEGGLYGYTFGGHGIGTNTEHPAPLDTTIERILKHNEILNKGGSLTFECSVSSASAQ